MRCESELGPVWGRPPLCRGGVIPPTRPLACGRCRIPLPRPNFTAHIHIPQANSNMDTMRIGTPEYMGPELISSRWVRAAKLAAGRLEEATGSKMGRGSGGMAGRWSEGRGSNGGHAACGKAGSCVRMDGVRGGRLARACQGWMY